MSKRPMRPRLEMSSKSILRGVVNPVVSPEQYDILILNCYNDSLEFDLHDAKRLHKFLGKAISYLESRKGRG